MKFRLIKEYKKIKNFTKFEALNLFARGIFSDLRFDIFVRFIIYKKFIFNNKDSKSSFNYFCLITKRTRGIIRVFRLSRILTRELAFNGNLPGIRKSSW